MKFIAVVIIVFRITKVLIDLTDFKFTPGDSAGQFHSDYVTKIYNMNCDESTPPNLR